MACAQRAEDVADAISLLAAAERPAQRRGGGLGLVSIRALVRRSRKRAADAASLDLLAWRRGNLTGSPPAATAPLAEQRAWWYAELRRHGFHDHERPDGRLIDSGPYQVGRPTRESGDEIAEGIEWHQALCRAWWRWPATADEREAVRLIRDGRRYATVAVELGRRKSWVVDVIRRAVAWGVAEGENDDGETTETVRQ